MAFFFRASLWLERPLSEAVKRRRTSKQSPDPSVASHAPSTADKAKRSDAFEFTKSRDGLGQRAVEATKAVDGPKCQYKLMMAKAAKIWPRCEVG